MFCVVSLVNFQTSAVLAPGIGNKGKKEPKKVDPNVEVREGLEALNKRRFLYTPSYEIYGGMCEHSVIN
jgi:hypothetical protein